MLNILDLIFINLAFMVTLAGTLINNFEKYVPAFIIKSYKYGSFAYKGSDASYIQLIEIPKSHYRHFYLFSSVFSAIALLHMICVYLFDYGVGYYVQMFLRIFLEVDHPSVCIAAAMTAMTLITIQCTKRLYETYFLQVFAKSSKMNINHYLAGLIHYFGCVVAVIGQAPLYAGNTSKGNIPFWDLYTTIFTIPCILTFLWASYEQFQTNIIFANMRRDKKSGSVITEEHGVPRGRMFNYISSPHRMCEIIMYTMLLILIPTKTFFCIYLWVIANQVQTAIQAHDWYKNTFKEYPKERMAIIPSYL